MIFQKLHAFAKQRGLLDDLDFVGQTIHGVISLTADGALAGVPLRLGDKKNPAVHSVAKLPARNSAAIAGVGADTLGRLVPGFDPGANAFARRTQQLFLEQMAAINAAQPEPHPGLTAIVAFLQSLADSPETAEAVSAALRGAKLLPTEWVTFQVAGQEDGLLCVNWPVVRSWWGKQQSQTRAEQTSSGDDAAICVVTGQLCQPQLTHGTRVKGIPGGRSGGIALVSGAGSAFNSYGFEKSLTSPMSEEAVEGYIRAVGYMVDHKDYHYRTGEVIHLFFGDQPIRQDNPGLMIQFGGDAELSVAREERSENPAEARKPFIAPLTGSLNVAAAEDATRFYSFSLSGNSARAIVRGWLDQTLPEAVQHAKEWFEDLEIRLDRPLFREKEMIAARGTLYHRWPLWQLVNTLQGQGENAKGQIIREQQQLWDCALAGRDHPMPLNLLLRAVSRIGTSGDLPPARAALIRCTLNRLQSDRPINMKKELDLQSQSRAYHCGRLLRVLANIQKAAQGDVGAGVIQKYYTAVSSMPGNSFGPLVAKAQSHLSKIADDPKHKGLAGWFENSLKEIHTTIVKLGGFPQTNNPVQQGEFALGFYFQEVGTAKQKDSAPAEMPALETAAA